MNFKAFSKLVVQVLPYLVVFIATLYHPYDNDLGWHLRYGQYFWQHHQVLRTNIFSTEMPNFHWVNSSWATDLISYVTFTHFGFLGLSVLGALIITASFYLFAKVAELDFFEKSLVFPALIVLAKPLNSVAFRGQLLSILLLGILMYILTHAQNVQTRFETGRQTGFVFKLIYLLPLLFALWSNLHGEFILGLGVFAITIGADLAAGMVSSKRIDIAANLKEKSQLIVVFLICTAAAVINPFGIGVYTESLKHFGDPLQNYIAEWLAFTTLSNYWWQEVAVGFFGFFGLLFLIFSNQLKDKISQVSVASILYLISFKLRRFLWPAYYFGMVLLAPVAAFFKPESKKYANIAAVFIFLIYLSGVFALANPFKRIQNMSWDSYCQKFVECSDGAIQYVIDHNLGDNLMSYYGWGGYIIWRYPSLKPSIDGRMHLWRDESGYSAFEDYYAFEQNTQDVDKSTYDVVLMSNQKPVYSRLNQLANDGKWQKVYEDKFAGVFVRNTSY